MFGMSAQQMSQSVFYAKVADSLGVGMGVVSLCYSASTLCASASSGVCSTRCSTHI